MPGRGGRVVLKAKWFLLILVMLSLVSTLLLGDTLTWLWSRTHVTIDELSAARLGQKNTGHSTMPADLKHVMGSHASPDQAVALSQSSGDPSNGVGSHLIADFRVPGSDDAGSVARTGPDNKASFVHSRNMVDTRTEWSRYTHRTAASGRPALVEHLSQTSHGVTGRPALVEHLSQTAHGVTGTPALVEHLSQTAHGVTGRPALVEHLSQTSHGVTRRPALVEHLSQTSHGVTGRPALVEHLSQTSHGVTGRPALVEHLSQTAHGVTGTPALVEHLSQTAHGVTGRPALVEHLSQTSHGVTRRPALVEHLSQTSHGVTGRPALVEHLSQTAHGVTGRPGLVEHLSQTSHGVTGRPALVEHLSQTAHGVIGRPALVEHLSQTAHGVKAEVTSMSGSDVTSLHILYNKLLQIEQASLVAADVSIRGSSAVVKHHLALVASAFQKFKVKVTYQEQDDHTGFMIRGGNHSIVMCLDTTSRNDNCAISEIPSVHSQVNIIPEIISVITSTSFVCTQVANQHHVPAERRPGRWYGGQLPCYSSGWLPDRTGDDCETTWGWWLAANISTGAAGQFVPCGLVRSPNSSQRSGEKIFVPLSRDLLTLDGMAPLVWQTEVLLTSWSPARVYLHPAGIAWRGLEELTHRKHPKNSSLLDLEQLLTEREDEHTARLTMTRLQSVLLAVVRSVEDHLSGAAAAKTRLCHKCFQQLQILLVFASTFQPTVLQVLPRQYTEHLSSLSDYLLEQNVLDDLVPLLVSRESTAADLLGTLHQLGVIYVRDDMICDALDGVCLGEHETNFLLNTRREQKSARNWIRLLPSTTVPCTMKHSALGVVLETESHERSAVESLALILEEGHLCPGLHKQHFDPAAPVQRDYPDISFSAELSDNSSWPYLSAIHTYPYIQLYPEFSPLNTDYRAYVDYQTTLVHVAGVSRHCKVEVRLEPQQDSNNRWANLSLGLGDNTVHLFLVSRDQPGPTIHNVYRITIHRKQAGHISGFDHHKGDYQVCSLKQDCSLLFAPTVPCGLQPVVGVLTWTELLQQHSTWPECHDGHVSGEWLVPCFNCQNESSCYWKQAIWQPPGCREGHLSTDKLKDCLVGKRVLFIGDSTNRGILHYIFQRLNGSLLEWDKTHTIRIYPSLNGGQTMFGFAYYPQFWRRPAVRPGLDKALYQLLNRTSQWSHRETVLVVGGVHWLTKHHLDIVVEIMRRAGPSKWTVVIKGLGAGFHQPVQGVHQLSLNEQQQLWRHSQAVLTHARSLGFSVVDTFSMTMSRFRDFRRGKCACHFHQVSAVQMSAVEKLRSPGSGDSPEARYHIQGHINAVYSEMIINRMCAHTGG